MLSLLNSFCHGYVATPIITSCVTHGLLNKLCADSSLSLESLVSELKANSGFLSVGLNALDILDLVKKQGDMYSATADLSNLELLPDFVRLYAFPPEDLLQKPEAIALLSSCINHYLKVVKPSSNRIVKFYEGALMVPLMIALKGVFARGDSASFSSLPESLKDDVGAIFVSHDWSVKKEKDFDLTEAGEEVIRRIDVLAIAASYRPMLASMDQLIFGDSGSLFVLDENGHERHLDRTMNVVASGFQHGRYFADAEANIVDLFNQEPIELQPDFIADMGCGDGEFLKKIYFAIKNQTLRGRKLDQFPIKVIGIDCNERALSETSRNLAEIPAIILQGDINYPDSLVEKLRTKGVSKLDKILHVRSFLDHNFGFEAHQPVNTAGGGGTSDASYVDKQGQVVGANQVLSAMREHLKRWASFISKSGMLVLECHSLSSSFVKKYFDSSECFYFDTLHALSRQYLISAEAFIVLAANVGIFPRSQPKRYPKTLDYCRITLSHFEPREYTVRVAEENDLSSLCRLEELCWSSSNLCLSKESIKKRLDTNSEGNFVLEKNGVVLGVIYSQRIKRVEDISLVDVSNTYRINHHDGPIVQLLALNVDPEVQSQGFGDELLEFMLQRCSVMNGVEKVVGVTRCKNFKPDQGSRLEEYLCLTDSNGYSVDPIIKFHQRHGASIDEVVPGFRPLDVDNQGCGVLIHYDLRNRKTYRDVEKVNLDPKVNGLEAQFVSPDEFIKGLVCSCLGEDKKTYFSTDTPLMDMGLDSADFLELNEQIFQTYNLRLEPTFFFKFNTVQKVVSYLEERVAVPQRQSDKLHKNSLSHTKKKGALPDNEDIAVIGVSMKLPGGISNLDKLWEALSEGRDLVGSLSNNRFEWPKGIDPFSTHVGIDRIGTVDEIDTFDANFFKISKAEAVYMDPQQRLLLEQTWHCLEDAGYGNSALKGTSTGVFIGASGSDYGMRLSESSNFNKAHYVTGTLASMMANRISYYYDFSGPSLLVDTACSSSLVALDKAIKSLRSGESKQALVGGINLICSPQNSVAYYEAGMLSKDGLCKTFDAEANGYVRGEGVVVLMLKPLDKAIADNDRVYSVIKGSSCNHGGTSSGLTAPNPIKQSELIQSAWRDAEVEPETISYIETHGTGTPLGDPIEVEGIKQAFLDQSVQISKEGFHIGLGSIKSNIGHLEAAAGLAGVLKVILCMARRSLLPNIHYRKLNPSVDIQNNGLYVVDSVRYWQAAGDCPRRAGVSSFGIGGANAHVILEEFDQQEFTESESEPESNEPIRVFLSARNSERLKAHAKNLLCRLESTKFSLIDIAYTLAKREKMDDRLVIQAATTEELKAKLRLYIEEDERLDDWQLHSSNDDLDKTSYPRAKLVDLPKYPFESKRYWLFSDQFSKGGDSKGQAAMSEISMVVKRWEPNAFYNELPDSTKRISKDVLVISLLNEKDSNDFKARYPEVDVELVSLGSKLYNQPKNIVAEFSSAIISLKLVLEKNTHEHCFLLSRESDVQISEMLSAALRSFCMELRIPFSSISIGDVGSTELQFAYRMICNDVANQTEADRLYRLRNQKDRLCYEKRVFSYLDLPNKQFGSRLRQHGVYWIVGGSGDIGRKIAEFLCDKYHATVILSGRRQTSERSLDSLSPNLDQKAIFCAKADVTNADEMALLASKISSEFGRINGVFHLAAVLRDSSIQNKCREDFKDVLSPKLLGVDVLDEVTQDMNLDFFIGFSSLTALFGNYGQADYSAANSYITSFILRRQRQVELGLRQGSSLSIHWPYWSGGGMKLSQTSRERLARTLNSQAISDEQGLHILERILNSHIVGEVGICRQTDQVNSPCLDSTSVSNSGLNSVSVDTDMVEKVAKIFSDVIELDGKGINLDLHFSDYGLDSFLVSRFAEQLSKIFELGFRPLDVYEHPSINQLSAHISEKLLETRDQASLENKSSSLNFVEGDVADKAESDQLAIVGIDIKVPGAETLDEFWELITRGGNEVGIFPLSRWKLLSKSMTSQKNRLNYKGFFLNDVFKFDNKLFKTSPREAMLMDPQHRLVLHSVWSAIENAGYSKTEFAKKSTSFFLALNSNEYAEMSRRDPNIDEFTGTGGYRYISANRVSHYFDLKGLSETIDTACSSIFVGISKAFDAIRSGASEQAIVSGIQLNLLPQAFDALDKQGLLSSTQFTSSFDQESDGFIRSEGVGSLILKPVSQAISDNDHIYGVVNGVGVRHGGKSIGLTTPNSHSMQEAMEQALSCSGIVAGELDYIEAHGTAMALGDAAEIEAFSREINKTTPNEHTKTPVGSVKPTLGHLEIVSGVAAIAKAALSFEKGVVPGIQGLTKVHRDIVSNRVALDCKPYQVGLDCDDKITSFGLNSYGLGGVSAFLVMSPLPSSLTVQRGGAKTSELFVLSAQTRDVLLNYAKSLESFLSAELSSLAQADFDSFIKTYQLGREVMPKRMAIVANGFEDLIIKLRIYINDPCLSGEHGIYSFEHAEVLNISDIEIQNALDEKDWPFIAKVWISGADISWSLQSYKRRRFPGYPFDKSKDFVVSSQTRKQGLETELLRKHRMLLV
ncbi:MAG: hypothetical protein C9356_20025 [Oleiphilus sp.]|nr:MAG: hypothetical protein C9356_20025 [Oleiphilus sp.]